eukprot:gnl/Spiro4/25188_TR12532_c0_g1_i1.p1 gnl/Spiro4/25188_TR12532_c0_g1~~gnl/Spiro4/25188_TR12532_c0_g1_i1.p1  ORF type:complete len:387 (-),score=82.84 gnl/Spiro4/25188_TR12532_c0_g1_i1:6-1106(-)
MGILERIRDIEAEMSRTQKNKATEYHLGLLKARLAKLRSQLIEGAGKSGAKGEGFDVMKSGDARLALIGFPSVGKSTLLTKLTGTQSAQAAYEFTTLTCIPGNILYHGATLQLLDLPGIIEGAAQGKGRGRQVIACARTSDMVVMMLDAARGDIQRQLLSKELESVGIRLNKQPPAIYIKRKKVGGLTMNSTLPLTHLTPELVRIIMHEYKIFNVDVLFRCDATADELIDVIEGSRVYLKCLYVYNKIDTITIEEVDRIARTDDSCVISCHWDLGLEMLLDKAWDMLALTRIYTKKPGQHPDFSQPFILRGGATMEHVCHAIHRDLARQFKYALVWGTSAKHCPQRVGLAHVLEDEDVIQIMKKGK